MNKKYIIISLIVLALIVVAAVLYVTKRTQPSAQNQPAPTAASVAPAAPQSLGGQIYDQAANPVGNKLPDVNPAKNANPIQGLNVNPF